MQRNCAFLAVGLVPSLTPLQARSLLEHHHFEPERIFSSSVAELCGIEGISRKNARAILHPELLEQAAGAERLARTRGWQIVTPAHPDYPGQLLGQIHDPPPALWVEGSTGALSADGIAVVGSRKATPYGRAAAEMLGRELASMGAAVFSGLARGIDAAAHRGALEGGGVTVGVLGCGLDRLYPPEHKRLARDIRNAGGALVTELPPGSTPLPRHFPLRNRIISGLSWGVLVVEADRLSGSLITARLGLEQGREVFAVPGNITSAASTGTNLLLAGGAKLVQRGLDALEEFPPEVRLRMAARVPDGADPRGPVLVAAARRGGAEGKVLEALAVDQARDLNDLSRSLGLPSPELTRHLLCLELEGLVRMLPGGRCIRTC
jgi:DNA processing protein